MKEGQKNGEFNSYYFWKGEEQGKALNANYQNGILIENMTHFDGKGKKVTEYLNIEMIEKGKDFISYKAYIKTYVGGVLKEEGEIIAIDEIDMVPFFDGVVDSSLEKVGW